MVKKIRWLLKQKYQQKIKVGHAGTLDPLATGLLVICSGKKTKEIAEFLMDEKEYTGTFHIGATTPSFDLETEIDSRYPIDQITSEIIYTTAAAFIGEQLQTPPVFSAKRIDGKRAYQYARNGEEVEMKKHLIHIYEFEITRIQLPEVDFRIRCSKGTYIRSIAYDFGKALKNGAYLKNLRRTKSGAFLLENAVTIDEFETLNGKLNPQ